jgi:hypothetical protein
MIYALPDVRVISVEMYRCDCPVHERQVPALMDIGAWCGVCGKFPVPTLAFSTVFTDQRGNPVSQWEACEDWGRLQQMNFLASVAGNFHNSP